MCALPEIPMHRGSRRGGTTADLFCDTYVVAGGRHSYIMLSCLATDKGLAERVLQPTARKQCLVQHDGFPAYRIRNRLAKALRKRRDNIAALFGDLYMMFTEEAIKKCFTMPNIWLLNHNEHARRARATEESELNRLRKLDRVGFALRRQCEARTANKSATKFTRETRELSRR